jgi:hypothetical protein
MVAAIYCRKSTEHTGVADDQNPSRASSITRASMRRGKAGPSMIGSSSVMTASAARNLPIVPAFCD